MHADFLVSDDVVVVRYTDVEDIFARKLGDYRIIYYMALLIQKRKQGMTTKRATLNLGLVLLGIETVITLKIA